MRMIVFFFVVALAGAAATAQSYSGAELRSELELWPLMASGKASNKDYARIGHAVGYIDGFADAYLHAQARGTGSIQDAFSFCLPKEFTIEDLRRSASSYLERHKEPFINTAPAGAVLARAFGESFPCRRR